jgi:hypothetical protein
MTRKRTLLTGPWNAPIALGLLLSLTACAGSAASAPASKDASDVASAAQDGEPARKSALRARRAATWAEYYADVMRRAKRHGGVVIWIQPPQVKEVEITAQR